MLSGTFTALEDCMWHFCMRFALISSRRTATRRGGYAEKLDGLLEEAAEDSLDLPPGHHYVGLRTQDLQAVMICFMNT